MSMNRLPIIAYKVIACFAEFIFILSTIRIKIRWIFSPDTNTTRLDAEIKPVPKPRVVPATSGGSSGYTEDEKRVLNHTSNINDNVFVPFMDVDLKERFVYPIPFNDKVRQLLSCRLQNSYLFLNCL